MTEQIKKSNNKKVKDMEFIETDKQLEIGDFAFEN